MPPSGTFWSLPMLKKKLKISVAVVRYVRAYLKTSHVTDPTYFKFCPKKILVVCRSSTFFSSGRGEDDGTPHQLKIHLSGDSTSQHTNNKEEEAVINGSSTHATSKQAF